MKFKIIIFSLALLMSLSLVCAFESPEYNIGMNIPSGEQGNIEVNIINLDIEFNITNETDNSDSNPETFGGSSGSRRNANSNPPEQNTDDGSETTNGKDETLDLTSGESEQENKGFFLTITGAVIGTLGTGGTIGAFVFILGIIGAFVFVRFKKRK